MLEWWQIVIGIVGALGFSAVPWVTALLAGRLLTLSVHKERMADKDAQIARLEREVAYEREAKHTEQGRADDAVKSLAKVGGELGETAVKLLEALPGGEVAPQ